MEKLINSDPVFHGAIIHTATLIEFFLKKESDLPEHLKYAIDKQPTQSSPYVRSAQLFRKFIRREITREEEIEFQRLLDIEEDEIRHIFDLAYLTNPVTRNPIFRFRYKL
jgi:hypothetical protein